MHYIPVYYPIVVIALLCFIFWQRQRYIELKKILKNKSPIPIQALPVITQPSKSSAEEQEEYNQWLKEYVVTPAFKKRFPLLTSFNNKLH